MVTVWPALIGSSNTSETCTIPRRGVSAPVSARPLRPRQATLGELVPIGDVPAVEIP
jgi:hypothetical protein